MILQELLQGVEVLHTNLQPDLEVKGIAYDSRRVQPGDLFVAITGFATDGNRYIPMALQKGAVAVVTAVQPGEDLPHVLVASDRKALAQLSANFFGHPARAMTTVGITGTNGKTSSTLLLKQILEQVTGEKVGLIGTMENLIGQEVVPTERTTPESYELQALFARMRDAGCRYMVMEVSSHAICLDRVGAVRYDVAAFTNLSPDHLDFHGTMENYCDAKAQLFAGCGRAVMNCDDPWFARMRTKVTCPVLTTSAQEAAGLYATDARLHSDGVSFRAVSGEKSTEVHLPIPGKFTVYNALTALGIALQLGISLEAAAGALARAKGVKGRVEVVPTPNKPYTVLIDYAHTPDGLENVLTSVRGFCKGRLIALFGCGGDRDRTKRPVMGAIGVKLADLAVITSDNPRTEVPAQIISDILAGTEGAENKVIIENRVQAIHYAMDIAKKDDIIVLAGKGHETYQEICGVKHHMDEREIVAEYL